MRKSIFLKSIALSLIIILLLSFSVTLYGCSKKDDYEDSSDNNVDATDDTESGKTEENYHDKIVVPAYKDFGRNTVNFLDISYSRPDFEAVASKISATTSLITENTFSFDEQIAAIKALEEDYNHVLTMYAFANIYNSKDSSSKFWNDEFSYIAENYPKFAEKVEDMLVAAANSPYAERFENEYFGPGLIEKYKDGGKYTEKMIQLWANEEKLEADYSSISTATVEITYKGVTDSVENIVAYYLNKYGQTSTEYLKAYTVCMSEYSEVSKEKSLEIFIELIKLRREIALELGYKNYLDYGYEILSRDYSKEQLDDFLDGVCTYVVPAYTLLNSYVFSPYFQNNNPSDITLDVLINQSYNMLSQTDSTLADIYHYMLQHGLYDIELSEINRQSGAFTTYLDSYNAPFIFLSASGNTSDYTTLLHEFGHFADEYINSNSSTSIDAKELSSQGLEYLMLLYMDGTLSAKDAQYLTYSSLRNAMQTLIFQGFYAELEELIYAIPSGSINKESLDSAVVKAAKKFGLNTESVNDISVAFIPHIFLYPFYVQSYAVSIVPAVELYFMESEEKGAGFEAYHSIIDRNDGDLSFEQMLTNASLSSPFEIDVLRKLSDDIYFHITGMHIYSDENKNGDGVNAA